MSPGIAAAGGGVGASGTSAGFGRASGAAASVGLRPGNASGLSLEVLRDAGGPLSDQGVTRRRWRRVGACKDRPEVLTALHKTSLAVLRRLTGKGAARAIELAGGGRAWVRA